MNILITGIGGPTPRSIARQVKKKYPNAKIVGVDASSKALGFYMRGLCDESFVVPRADDPSYWDVIHNLIESEKIDFAFVQPELEVKTWGIYYQNHQAYPCPVLIPPLEHTENLMDKAKMSDLLKNTMYIPKTIRISPDDPKIKEIENQIGFPCWIRASVGSGGLGSLKINRKEDLEAWLFIHKNIKEFTVSEYLEGRHLANQMLFIDGELIKNAGLECVEYVMAEVAPSKVTGNTSFGRFINEEHLLEFCEEVMGHIGKKLNVKPHGVYSFDLKEDSENELKVTEINIRHMAYTGIMAEFGFDLVDDTIKYLSGKKSEIKQGRHRFGEDYIFLRDVDIEPILIREGELLGRA